MNIYKIMKRILVVLMLLLSVPALAQEFKEDKFALTYYDLDYSPQGKKTEPYFVIQEIDKQPRKVDPELHLFKEGKPGAFNFSKFKNRWMKGATAYIKEFDKILSKKDICELLKIKPTNRDDKLLFIYSGVFTVGETGDYRLKSPCDFMAIGTNPGNLRAVYSWKYNGPEGNNPVKIELEPKTYKEQWKKYHGHWVHLVAGTKYYFVSAFQMTSYDHKTTLRVEKIKSPNEEISVVKPFKSIQK